MANVVGEHTIKANIIGGGTPISANIIQNKKKIVSHIQTYNQATTTTKGIMRIATLEEAITGIDNTIAITPYTLHNVSTYTEGNGINITNKEISVDDSVIATKAFVNEEINILDNQISLINNTINTYGDIVTYNAADFATKNQGLLADSALQPNDNISELVNNVGYITGITSSDIQTALGYIPYSSENPSGFITINALNGYATENWVGQQGYLTSSDLSGYATEQWVNNQGFIKGISNTDVINALGYTPYDNSNPAGYITSASLPTVNNSTITIQKNGSDIESFNLNQPTNETINITVPTQTSDLTNNSGFITNTVNNLTNYYLKSETYTKTEVQDLISGVTGLSIQVVNSLPVTGENGVIYLVPKEGASPDIYDEYIWVETNENYELIGNTEIDLTDYATITYVDTGLSSKANDNAVVHLSGNETVNGKKTFNDVTYFKDTIASISSASDPTSLNFRGGTNGISFSIGAGEVAKLTNQLFNVTKPINATTPAQDETENKRVTTIGYINTKLANYVQSSDLATVATTGDYDDLSNKPTIPTVGNGTITFTQGGVTKGTITTNQSGNTTIALDVGGGAVDSVNGQTGTVVLTASDVGALADTTTIPSKTSDLTNDSGFITGITSSDVTTALGYTPYNSTNPSGYITSSALNGYATETWVGNQGYLTGITSSDVITALTYTPYNGTTNPNGYITSADLPTNYVTTDTAQNISGRKTFLGEKAIYFKQSATSNKLGFTLYNPSNSELGAFEYRPSTIGTSALLNINTSYANDCYVGFRYWGTAVNIVAPKVATAGNYYIPTHITDGNTTVTASNTGTVNISTLLPDISTKQDTLVSGTNIKTINNTSLLGSGNIDTDNIFIADYGVTSFTDINIAFNAGKAVFCKYPSITGFLPLSEYSSTLYIFKTIIGNNQSYSVGIDSENTWSYRNDVLELLDNKVTSISSSSTDSEYPSAKCVYNNLQNKQNTLVSGTNIKTINSTSLLGSGDIPITVPTSISDLTDDTSTYPIDKADTLTGLTATVSELNVLDGITASTTELNSTDGVTSNIQTQLDGKVNSSDVWYDSSSSTLYIGVPQS